MKDLFKEAISAERQIIEFMCLDGFDPPQIGESRTTAMKKVANYILEIRRRANDLQASTNDQETVREP